MQRRSPAGTARWVRSVMCRERSPFPSSRIPFSNRKNVRRLFAEEERPCSAGPRRALPAGYGA